MRKYLQKYRTRMFEVQKFDDFHENMLISQPNSKVLEGGQEERQQLDQKQLQQSLMSCFFKFDITQQQIMNQVPANNFDEENTQISHDDNSMQQVYQTQDYSMVDQDYSTLLRIQHNPQNLINNYAHQVYASQFSQTQDHCEQVQGQELKFVKVQGHGRYKPFCSICYEYFNFDEYTAMVDMKYDCGNYDLHDLDSPSQMFDLSFQELNWIRFKF
eukprot:403349895